MKVRLTGGGSFERVYNSLPLRSFKAKGKGFRVRKGDVNLRVWQSILRACKNTPERKLTLWLLDTPKRGEPDSIIIGRAWEDIGF